MSTLAERLRLGLQRKGARPADLARACKVKPPSVAEWLNGTTKRLASDNSRLAAAFLGCRREWLELGLGHPGWTDQQHGNEGPTDGGVAQNLSDRVVDIGISSATWVPVIGTLTMGDSKHLELRAAPDGASLGRVLAHNASPNSIALQVFGDDLYPAVRHGMCLIVDPSAPPVIGELVLLEMAEGWWQVVELVALGDDAVTWLPAAGGQRRTVPRGDVTAVQPVIGLVPGSRIRPA